MRKDELSKSAVLIKGKCALEQLPEIAQVFDLYCDVMFDFQQLHSSLNHILILELGQSAR